MVVAVKKFTPKTDREKKFRKFSDKAAEPNPERVKELSTNKKVGELSTTIKREDFEPKQKIFPKEEKKESEVIRLNEAPRDLQDRVDNPQNFGEQILSKAGSLQTTAALAGTLAAISTGGASGAGKASFDILGRTATTASTRAIVGKAAQTGITKVPSVVRNIATRFASNAKSSALTKGFMVKLGLSLGAASALKDIVGTYPFAGFIKEEAVQTMGFATKTAIDNEDIEGIVSSIKAQEEILNPTTRDKIINSIPYVNVQNQLKSFFKASKEKLEVDKRKAQSIVAGDPDKFQIAAEQSRQRELLERQADSQYFALIREGKYDEAEQLLSKQLEGGLDNEQ